MIKFFRNIRQNLIKEGKTINPTFAKATVGTYLKYAIGEIVLVVIGILIALQVNNWNTNRKQKERFNGLLEQIYNSVYVDLQWQLANQQDIIAQAHYIDSLIANPLKLDPRKMVTMLFYVNLEPTKNISKTRSLLQYLDFNSEDKIQYELTKQLVAYGGDLTDDENKGQFSKSKSIVSILQENNIPQPNLIFGFASYHNFSNADLNFFSDQEINRVKQIIGDPETVSTLKTLRSDKVYKLFVLQNKISENNNYLAMIKSSNTSVKLAFNNIGIVGNSLETGWDKTVFMHRSATDENKWEINVQLNDGYLKFRNSNSWVYNWGGKNFPKGNTSFYGEDISVTKGNYHITLDLDNNTYEFDKVDN